MRRGAKPNRLQIENRISATELGGFLLGLHCRRKGINRRRCAQTQRLGSPNLALSRTETSLILSCFLFPRLLGGEGAVLCSSYSLGSALSIERIAFKRLPVDYTTSR